MYEKRDRVSKCPGTIYSPDTKSKISGGDRPIADSLKSLRACYLNRNNFELNLKLSPHVILAFDR